MNINKTTTGGVGGNVLKWTFEKMKIEALKYNNRTDFMRKSSKAYQGLLKLGHDVLDECCSHMIEGKKKNGTWTNIENVHKEALKYLSKSDFANYSSGAYDAAQSFGWIEKVCSHMASYRVPKGYWLIKENCYNESLKFKTMNEFQTFCKRGYKSSERNGWLSSFTHLL